MTTWLHENFKLAPADCFTDPQDGTVVCPLPGDPFPAIPSSGDWYAVTGCPPTLDGNLMCPLHVAQEGTGTSLDSALAQMASADALAPRIPDSFFDGGAPADFSGLFLGAALLAGVAASGVAMLLTKLRKKNLAKQSVEATS